MITLASQRYTIAAYNGTLDSRYPLGFDPSPYDYFIGPYGSDSNDGLTTDTPWAITALGSKTASIANKRVGLLDGTYNCYATTTGGNDGGIQLAASGVTVQAVNARQAILTTNSGGSYPQSTSPVVHVTGDNVTFKNLRLAEFSWCPIRIDGDDLLIEGCDFYDSDMTRISGYSSGDNNGHMSFGTLNPARTTIRNCRFERARNAATIANDNNTLIGPVYRNRGLTVESCSFFDCNSAIFYKDANSGPLVVDRCYFDSTIAKLGVFGALTTDVSPYAASTVKHCVFNRNGYAVDGQVVNANGDTETVLHFYHNTVITTTASNTYAVAGIAFQQAHASNLSGAQLNASSFYNNVFYYESGTSPSLIFTADATTPTSRFGVIDYNLYSYFKATDSTTGGATYTTLAGWQSRLNNVAVTGQEAHSLVDTPTFVNSSATNAAGYALSTGSPGEGDGKVGGVIGGATTDMGAFGNGVTSIGVTW